MYKILSLLLALVVIVSSCKQQQKYPYAIGDFPEKYQSQLVEIVSRTVATQPDYVRTKFTTQELEKLSKSEHPVLRAWGLRTLLSVKKVNAVDLIISHIDDTAIISVDHGEFGEWDETVTDDLIFHAEFTSKAERDSLARIVIFHHNKLKAAYMIVELIEMKEEYYARIKEMTMRKNLPFDYLRMALFGLARYQKKEDIDFITKTLMANCWQLSYDLFDLMDKFPQPEYLDVLDKYVSDHLRYEFRTNGTSNLSKVISVITAYKTKESAIIIARLVNDIPSFSCFLDEERWTARIAEALWKNRCPAYAALLSKTKKYWIGLEETKTKSFVEAKHSVPKQRQEEGPCRWASQ
jgi:hypothetical protein